MTELFFEKLSHRFRKENDLSDITWALGEACAPFQKLFIKFFFSDIDESSRVTLFKREHSDDDCRPDFYLKIDGKEFIIECKINDRNDHFAPYRTQFPNARFGYITNYKLTQNDPEIIVKQWNDFKIYLEESLIYETDNEIIALINAYNRYLTNVCGLFKLKKMNLSNLSSLHDFNNMIKKIVSTIDDHETSLYNQGRNYDSNRSGQYFELKKGKHQIWPWLGVYYNMDKVCIYIEFNKKWCENIYDKIDPDRFSIVGEFFNPPYKDDDYGPAVCFELKETLFLRFNDPLTTVEEQEALVRKFVKEVIALIGIYFLD
jgi:hypothetical protein